MSDETKGKIAEVVLFVVYYVIAIILSYIIAGILLSKG